MTFDQWMSEIDILLMETIFLSSDDLADQPYRDWFNMGLEPIEAVDLIRDEEGF